MTTARLVALKLAVVAGVLAAGAARAQDMPDPSLIHGKAIPATELADGTVTVRVVRETIGNNIAGQAVTVTGSGRTWSATTDELGRAEFRGLPRGSEARAEATVNGERLVSDPIAVPTKGGLRVILVAGLAQAGERRAQERVAALAAPPVKGVVTLGGNTRILAEFQSDALRFFYELDIINSARTRVDIGGPFVLDLPRDAGGAEIREGSSKTASINGTHLTVTGPFDPGTTTVNLVFELRYSGHEHTFAQTWPVSVSQWFVGVEKVNGVVISSPQMPTTEERATEEGTVFVVSSGAPMAAGSTFTLQLANLPAQSRVAPTVAVSIAVAILALGAWLSFSGGKAGTASRAALEKRRDSALGKLEDLERSKQKGSIADERYASRRERLIRDLEQIYSELDTDTAGLPPGGGGRDVAA